MTVTTGNLDTWQKPGAFFLIFFLLSLPISFSKLREAMFYFPQNTLDTVDIGTTLFEENPGQTLLSTSNHICKQLFDGLLAKEKERKCVK